MSKTHPPKTKDAIEQRQTKDFCNDCDRYKAFCSGRRIWFNNDDYWVCDQCIADGRPEQDDDDDTDQQSILTFIGDGR
ncbi:hypothetical protein [Natronomonas gomsonensis]|uniref:hypothetical protein n=1 Tax=Natronomonas gomsonensis TaxID=1046043 RepID=UPI0015C1478D|nr:hypothetical protein [Natronomonas gomsonensis]